MAVAAHGDLEAVRVCKPYELGYIIRRAGSEYSDRRLVDDISEVLRGNLPFSGAELKRPGEVRQIPAQELPHLGRRRHGRA
jgi:hypothetical protein